MSDLLPGFPGCLLTVVTPNVVLLAWQGVSDFIPCPTGYLLTVLTVLFFCWYNSQWVIHARSSFVPLDWFYPYYFIFSWQGVSDLMLSPAECLWLFWLQLWSCWLNRKWVIPWQIQLGAFSLSSLPLWSHWLDSLCVIICQVHCCALWLFTILLWSCWSDSQWVILCQVHLYVFWMSLFTLWFCWPTWLDRKWVVSYQV